jgi:HSP20 family protein
LTGKDVAEGKASSKGQDFSFKIGVSDGVEDRIRQLMEAAKKKPGPIGPFIYGFNLRFDEQGNPVCTEFGNVSSSGVHGPGVREPLTDVIERESNVTVIVELPGVEEKDIKVGVREDSIEIRVDAHDRKYLKNIKLSCRVNPKTVHSGYKNGILQIKLDRI